MVIAEDMLKLKHYDWTLFMGQLSLEKFLKGLYEKRKNDTPPFIHDLAKLASLADLTLSKQQLDDFQEITTFHIAARYENIKYQLYKKATKDYTEAIFTKIKEYALWLQSLY